MEKEEIIEYLKSEENIEWLECLNSFLKSHIELLRTLEKLEKKQIEG